MPRRRVIESTVSQERWLISYADFITLLFAFFVVMYSISQVSETKYKALSDALTDAFKEENRLQLGGMTANTIIVQQDPSINEVAAKYESIISGSSKNQRIASFAELSEHFSRELEDLISADLVEVKSNEFWLEIELNANILFDSAEATLTDEAVSIFEDVAVILAPFENPIQVEGFTDNIPISNSKYPSNWELSSARASSVVRLLVQQGVAASRLSAVGFSDNQAIASNATAEGRISNRRVALMISKIQLPRPVSEEPGENLGKNTNVEALPYSDPNDEIVPSADRLAPVGDIKPVELEGGGLLFTNDPDRSQPTTN